MFIRVITNNKKKNRTDKIVITKIIIGSVLSSFLFVILTIEKTKEDKIGKGSKDKNTLNKFIDN